MNVKSIQTEAWSALRKLLLDYWQKVVLRRRFWAPVLLIAALGFGFSVVNRSVSIDNLSRSIYLGEGHAMIASTRWGTHVWNLLFSELEYAPFADKLLGLCFHVLAGALLGCIFYQLDNRSPEIWRYAVTAALYVSFPLVNEIWEYYGACLALSGNLALIMLAVLYQLSVPKHHWSTALVAGLLLLVPMASYESSVFAYVTLVLLVLFGKHYLFSADETSVGKWFREGLGYAVPAVLAFVLRYIIGFGLIAAMGLQYEPVGSTGITWIEEGVKEGIRGILKNAAYYGARALEYFPITVFFIAALGFLIWLLVYGIRRKRGGMVLLGLLVLASLFLQSLLQGAYMPYRTGMTLQVFVAVMGFLLLVGVDRLHLPVPKARQVVTVLLLFLCLRQSLYLNQLLTLNQLRSENESAITHYLGIRLTAEHDLTKPVVFVGKLELGDWIQKQIIAPEDSLGEAAQRAALETIHAPYAYKEYVMTDVNSFYNWARWAFHSQRQYEPYFAYHGYRIHTLEGIGYNDILYYEDYAHSIGMKPFEILESDDLILVYLGDNPIPGWTA